LSLFRAMDRSALTAAIKSVTSRRVRRISPGGVVARVVDSRGDNPENRRKKR
jgi:hypothetical protein